VRHEFEPPVDALPPEDEVRATLADLEARVEALESGTPDPELAEWLLRRRLRGTREQLEAIESGEGVSGLPTFAQVLAIGDVALVGWPAEVFYEIGEQVREDSPFATTLTVTHVNGSIGYVPMAYAYEEGGYEITARAHHMGLGITPEAEGVMVRETLQALAKARKAIG